MVEKPGVRRGAISAGLGRASRKISKQNGLYKESFAVVPPHSSLSAKRGMAQEASHSSLAINYQSSEEVKSPEPPSTGRRSYI